MAVTRPILAISDATGAIYGLRVVEHLHARTDIEIYLVTSDAGV